MNYFSRPNFSLLLILLLVGCLLVGCAIPVQPAPETVSEAQSETQTITHAMGEAEVPVDPQRVVVLDTGEIDNALALGANIIGAPIRDIQQYQEYLTDQFAGITDTGTIGEPNLETIVSLDPDLILGSKQRYEEIYDQLSAIAPTVLTESLRVPWQDNFRLHAAALGKSAAAEELIAAYDARTAAIREALGDALPTISIIRFRPGQVRLYLKSSYIGYILQDVGLPRPPAQDEDLFSAEIGLEQVADIDADYIFITGYAQDDSDQDTFLQSELWTTLGGVQSGNAIDVNDDTWIAGLGVQSANLVLDDLIDIFGLEINDTESAAEPATGDNTTVDAFPVTIAHKYGSTTLEAKPARIVTVGLMEQDALLALGIVPVGTSEWFGDYPGSIWPWAQDEVAALGGEVPAAVGGETINFEAIAGLQPDLILALYAGITQEEYDLLTQIAPTVAQPEAYVDYGIPWQALTLTVGEAVGQADAAAALVADVEAQFTAVQEAYPEFTAASSIVATPWQGIWVYGDQDVRGRFLTMLGFTLPEGLQEVTGTEFGGNLSMERADLLDVDVIIWLDAEEAEGELGGPVYQSLPVHTEGREVHLSSFNDPLGGATSFVTVLSLPYLLEELVPQLADAMGLGTRTLPIHNEVPATSLETDSDGAAHCEAGYRTVEGAFGATCIPVAPERIIAMNESVMANLLALDVTPIGVQDWTRRDFTRYLGDTTATVPSVGATDGPNYEAMLALDPDLILAMSTDVDAESLALLEKVAPVAVSTVTNVDWRGNLLFTGDVVGKGAAATALVEQTDVRLAEFRAAYAAQAPTDETIAIIRSRADSFNIYWTDSFISELVTEAGLQMPAAFQAITERSLSLEAIPLLTSDKLFVMVRNEQESGMFSAMAGNALWATLPAAQNDEVYVVNWSVWVAGWNIIGTNLVIDDLYHFLLDAEPATPNPFANLIDPDFGPQSDDARLGIE